MLYAETILFTLMFSAVLYLLYRTNTILERIERDDAIKQHQERCPGYLQNERRQRDCEKTLDIIGTDRREKAK